MASPHEFGQKYRAVAQYVRPPYKFKCKECGSTDLEFKVWVNQDMEITDDCEEHPFCNNCQEETRCE